MNALLYVFFGVPLFMMALGFWVFAFIFVSWLVGTGLDWIAWKREQKKGGDRAFRFYR